MRDWPARLAAACDHSHVGDLAERVLELHERDLLRRRLVGREHHVRVRRRELLVVQLVLLAELVEVRRRHVLAAGLDHLALARAERLDDGGIFLLLEWRQIANSSLDIVPLGCRLVALDDAIHDR